MGALTIGREDDVAVATFDLPDEPVNKFTDAVIEEFDATFERLGSDTSVSAIVVPSGKPDVFIASADIEVFVSLQTREEAETDVRFRDTDTDRVAKGVSHARSHLEQAKRRRQLASQDVDRLSAMVDRCDSHMRWHYG